MKVLLATDGSEYSESAVDEACRKIFRKADEIKIVSVAEPVRMMVGAPFGVANDYYAELKKEALRHAAENAGQAAARIRGKLPGQMPAIEVLYGEAARSIVERAEEWGADLIVVGSHGRGFWARAVLGSVSSYVVSHAPCSVLVIRRSENEGRKTR